MDPNYWHAYAALAKIYLEAYQRPAWSRSLGLTSDDAFSRMYKYLQIAMKDPPPLAYAVSAEMHWGHKDFEGAIAEATRAVSLDPNDPESHHAMGLVLMYSGRHREAADSFKIAMRLDPFQQDTFGYMLGIAYFHMLKLEKAATLCERSFKSNPENSVPLWYLAAAYAHLGREQEAEVALAKLREVVPQFSSLIYLPYIFKYKDPADYNLLADGLRKAGMP